MAIKKTSILNKVENRLNRFEELIDNFLDKETPRDDGTIMFYVPDDWHSKDWDLILNRYIKAGWNEDDIEYISGNQREPGDMIRFTVN